jgi:transcriptional regulator of heat shock response
MQMSPRHAQLLTGLVREYIDTAEPIGSRYLIDVLSLAFSPATVRNLLHELEEAGYLEQPHTSAGRIPTDLGYRFYVDHLRVYPRREVRRQEPATVIVRRLASGSGAVAVSGLPDGRVEASGLSEFLRQPENLETSAALELSSLLDNIHDYLEQLSEIATPRVTVYIGRENPAYRTGRSAFPTEHLSVLVRSTPDRTGRQALLVLIGGKRMPYARNLSLLNQISRIL